MKTNSIIKSILFTVGFSAIALVGSAQAQVINVNVGPISSGATLTGTGSNTSTVAPIAYSGTFWNEENSYGGYTLETSTGGSTSIEYALGVDLAGTYNNNAASPSNITLFNAGGYNYTGSGLNGGIFTIALSGLTPNQNYNLAFVSQYDNGGVIDGGIFSIAGYGTQTSTGQLSTAHDTLLNGTNYVEFTNVQTATGNLTVDVAGTPYGYNLGVVGGFQIQEVAAAPEPSTYALMGLGALALLVVSRRRLALK